MAEIDVRKKSSMTWLWWLLAALIVAGLLWWILDDEGPERPLSEPATMIEGTQGVEAAGEPINDVLLITTSPDAGALNGRAVRLETVPVLEVVSDAGFWVGTEQQRAFVLLNEIATPNTPIEGRRNVEPGQSVTIVGTVHAAAEAAPQGTNVPTGVDRYIVPTSVEIVGNR